MESSEITDYDARVADTDGLRKVVLNVGSESEFSVHVGQRFVVFSLGREVFDPETNESLGRLEEVKGRGKVTHIQPQMCTIETYEYETRTVKVNPHLSGVRAAVGLPTEEEEREYDVFDNAEKGDYARAKDSGGHTAML